MPRDRLLESPISPAFGLGLVSQTRTRRTSRSIFELCVLLSEFRSSLVLAQQSLKNVFIPERTVLAHRPNPIYFSECSVFFDARFAQPLIAAHDTRATTWVLPVTVRSIQPQQKLQVLEFKSAKSQNFPINVPNMRIILLDDGVATSDALGCWRTGIQPSHQARDEPAFGMGSGTWAQLQNPGAAKVARRFKVTGLMQLNRPELSRLEMRCGLRNEGVRWFSAHDVSINKAALKFSAVSKTPECAGIFTSF